MARWATPTRKATLAAYDEGEIQVIANVAVLTEGWDHPPTSCVVLLRPVFLQVHHDPDGRAGACAPSNPEEYPGVVKTDCVILDFGTSSLIHGSLEQDVDLDGRPATGDAPTKTCPACEAEIPPAVMECPLCGDVCARARRGCAADAAAARPLRHDGDRPAGALELRVGRPLRRRRRADGQRLHRLGRGLLSSTAAGMRVGGARASAARLLGVGEQHRLPRRGRRLAQHQRDRRERPQDQGLAAPAADRKAARLPAARVPAWTTA